MSQTEQNTLELEPADEKSLERSRELRDELHGRNEEDEWDDGINTSEPEPYGDEEEEVMVVGGKYRVELSYSCTYTTTVIAASESHAKEVAEDGVRYGAFTDADQVWKDIRELEEIYEDDERAEEHDLTW